MDPGARSVPPARSVSLRRFPWPEKLRMAGSLRNSVMKLRWLGSPEAKDAGAPRIDRSRDPNSGETPPG